MALNPWLRLSLLVFALVGFHASAAEENQDQAPSRDTPYEPLRPANLASPRDTLNTFLTEYRKMLEEHFREGQVTSNKGLAAYGRALATMDFSYTPDGGSRWVQTERLVYMQEVLDKLTLPAMEDIPGVEEVDAVDLKAWHIPGTEITIVRADKGLHKGQWRFSPRTVELLPRYYRQTIDLPSRPGAVVGLFAILQANEDGIINRERAVGNRLRAVNTDSPRSTFEGFLRNMNQAYEAVMAVEKGLGAKPPTMSLDEARAVGQVAEDNLRRAVATLDLSGVPDALRYDTGIETAMQIKEVMDRMAPPPIDQIPNLEMVRQIRSEMGNTNQPIRWVYPNTAFEIIEVMEGPEQGNFRFSPHTVRIAGESYNKVKDLPYRKSHFNHFSAKYESGETSPGFYRFYSTTPGSLIPLATFSGRMVHKLPDFLHEEYQGQALWQWVVMSLLYTLTFFVALLIFLTNRRLIARCSNAVGSWLRVMSPLLVSGLIYWVTWYITNEVNITGQAILTIITIGRVLVTLLIAWAAFCFVRALAETLIALPQINPESVDASLLRLSSHIIGIILTVWVVIVGLNELGISIWPLIAGLGVGGLAVALAFRPTMENLIGSFMIFADQPYKIGQRIKVLDADGTVEAIGLRSTKIRLLSGHLTTIPNEKMASVVIENIGQRPFIRRVLDVTITYDTHPKKINRAVEILREILAAPENEKHPDGEETKPHPNAPINQPDFPPRVYFNNLNPDSLNILVIYWYSPPQTWDFLEHANWINVQIMERFAAEGIEFAFPTQTLHLSGDKDHPLTVDQRWTGDDEGQSPLSLFSQAAAFGAHSALGKVSLVSASDAVKPDVSAPPPKEPNAAGDSSDAPIEDGIMDSDDDGGTR